MPRTTFKLLLAALLLKLAWAGGALADDSEPAVAAEPAAEVIEADAEAEAEAAPLAVGPPEDSSSVDAVLEEPVEPDKSPRVAAYDRMVRLIEEKRIPEAVEAAKAIVSLTEAEFGTDSIKLAPALDNLATVQGLNGEYAEAVGNYQRSIAIIRQNEGMLSVQLVNPYVGLGATYNRAGRYEQAEEAYATALRLNHVNDGFYNLDQLKIRDGLTESYIGLEEFEDANFHQEIQLEINQRYYGETNPDVAPAMYKLARWYERAGLIEDARYTYQRARAMIKKQRGKEAPELVAALEGEAATYRRQGMIGDSAARLKKALDIIEKQEETDRSKQAELMISLGDLWGGSGRSDTANAWYEKSWQVMAGEPVLEDMMDTYFGKPVRVTGLGWNTLRYAPGAGKDPEAQRDGFLLMRYTVNTQGRAEDVVVIEAEPEDLMEKRVRSALKRSYFRPRFADGVAIDTEGMLYRHDFRYRPKAREQSEDAGKPLEPPPSGGSGRLDYPEAGG